MRIARKSSASSGIAMAQLTKLADVEHVLRDALPCFHTCGAASSCPCRKSGAVFQLQPALVPETERWPEGRPRQGSAEDNAQEIRILKADTLCSKAAQSEYTLVLSPLRGLWTDVSEDVSERWSPVNWVPMSTTRLKVRFPGASSFHRPPTSSNMACWLLDRPLLRLGPSGTLRREGDQTNVHSDMTACSQIFRVV